MLPETAVPPPICRRILALAERDPRRAVSLARRACTAVSADDSVTQAWTHCTLGWTLLCWERFDEARAELQSAHDRFTTLDVPHGSLRCRYGQLLADARQSAHDGLLAPFERLTDQLREVQAPYQIALLQLEHARLLNVLGRPHDAEALLRQAAPLLTHGNPSNYARLVRIGGVAAYLRGNYPRAVDLLDQAERLFATTHNRLEMAKCWFEQAVVALRQERLDHALAQYQRAERNFVQLDLPLQRAFCSKDVGLLLMLRGTYDQALHRTLSALEQFTILRRSKDVGMCYLHVGNIYFYTGHWDAANAAYTRTEAICVETGVIGYALIARRNRAMVYRAQSRRDEARVLLATIEEQAHHLGNRAELAAIWETQGALLADEEHYDTAISQYQRASDLFLQIDNRPAAAACVLEQGWLELQRGAFAEARHCFRNAAPLLDQQPHYRWRTNYGLARCAEADGELQTALAYYRTASRTVAELRGCLLSEILSSSLYTQAERLHVDALRLAARLGDGATLLALSEEQRALTLERMLATRLTHRADNDQSEQATLMQQLGTLLDDNRAGLDTPPLDAVLAAYGRLVLRVPYSIYGVPPANTSMRPFDLTSIREALSALYNADWMALVYLLIDHTLLIISVTSETLTIDQQPLDPQLHHLIDQATSSTYRQYTYSDLPYKLGQVTQSWAILRALADHLLPTAVQAWIAPQRRLLIIPVGQLHTLPWAALRLQNGWLIERATIQLAPSLSVWHAIATHRSANGRDTLRIGCRAFGGRAAALPGVVDELAAIAAVLPEPGRQLLDQQATRETLLEYSRRGELATCRLLHIASHAQLLSAGGQIAHLKLWDGDLLLPEVASLHLENTLVTLSACDGAAADILPGEEVLSLTWAFLAAGANGVLASLWQVYDRAALIFMRRFYTALCECEDAAQALAGTQRSLIAGEQQFEVPLIEPHCWANFMLIGAGDIERR